MRTRNQAGLAYSVMGPMHDLNPVFSNGSIRNDTEENQTNGKFP